MKKVLFISLLLVAVFLIGSAGVASAQCNFQQDYTCKVHVYKNGELSPATPYPDCVRLCYEDFAVDIDDLGGEDFWGCTLYPALDYQNLLGLLDSEDGPGGCSVEFPSRRSITVKLTFIEEDEGYVDVYNCTPCNNCCSSLE